MEPEEKARKNIDNMLKQAGWSIQDRDQLNLGSSFGVAVREFPLTTGPVDYLLFVDRVAVGTIEAKPEGHTLSGVAEQTDKYSTGMPDGIPSLEDPLPFLYESTGIETFFRNLRDPDSRSRRVFHFHKPETLKEWSSQQKTLRAKMRELPELITQGMYDCQVEAVTNLEKSFKLTKPRALIQMATGSGKTFTAVTFINRLIEHANAKRILFLVDRSNLGRQTLREFQQYVVPGDGRKFTELYNVQHLRSNTIDPVSRVCISTIQRVYSMLSGEEEYSEDIEEESLFEVGADGASKVVSYNSKIPIEEFDFIVTDECHRSIYHLWRQALEYFDGFIIGLTATPSKQTFGFFNQNLVMEYSHERAVADGVNVGYEVYRIKTEISEEGSQVDAGFYVDVRDRYTRAIRWKQLDEDLEYTRRQLDSTVVSEDQIRTIIRTFRDKLPTDIFPGRTEVPKTLVFSKTDSHAEDIVHIIREEFGKGNDFCKKITSKVTGVDPEDLIRSFRNDYNPRIAVSVDMLSTGSDIRSLECLLFMRDVKSRIYFDQMKGRGTRVVSPTELQSVTSDADYKTHFIIVDAVGVCESNKTDTQPLERKRTVPFDKLISRIAMGDRSEDHLSSLAGRLARLDRKLHKDERAEIEKVSEGLTLNGLANGLLNAIDPDKIQEVAQEKFKGMEPTEEQITQVTDELAKEACLPFDNPNFRNLLMDLKRKSDQIIDKVSQDIVTFAGFDDGATDKATNIIESFKEFIEENKDELTALQIIYEKPYGERHLTFEQIKQLAEAIRKPPYHLDQQKLWEAYKQLEKVKVKNGGPQTLLTNIVSLVRFAIGESEDLIPFPSVINEQFESWLEQQGNLGREFTLEQLAWLTTIKDHIATSVNITDEDFEYGQLHQMGGLVRASQIFGDELREILEELNEELTT